MLHLLINWLLSALALWLVSRIISGFYVKDYTTALIASVVITIVNTLLGWPLKILTFPLTVLTLGLFWLALNAILLMVASAFVPGFSIKGFGPAFFGSIVMTILYWFLTHVFYSHVGLF